MIGDDSEDDDDEDEELLYESLLFLVVRLNLDDTNTESDHEGMTS